MHMVTDFHSHILPGIDDGSRSADSSIRMLNKSKADGVDRIVLTPHFYATKDNAQQFLERREKSAVKLWDALDENGGRDSYPVLHIGAEVYYFPGMGRADMLPKLCISGSDIIMVEMPFAQWDASVVRDIEEILEKQKLRVIIAHIERYYRFQKKKEFWNEVFDLPVIPQMNAECFLDGFMKRRFGIQQLKQNPQTLLGSDCHNMHSRIPNLMEGRAVIEKKLGREALDEIDRFSSEILKNE